MTLNSKMARGAAWMIGARFAIRALGIVSTLILVRLLLPSDFGLVALATAFVAGLELIKTFSFDVALIQDQDAGPEKYNAAWTVNLVFSLLLAVVLVAAAAPVSKFYADERLQSVFFALSFSMIIQGLENIGTVDFRKNLEFQKEFNFLFFRKIAAFIVTIILALWLRSYWALVAGIITSSLVGTMSSYVMHPYRPRLGRTGLLELFHFSKWLVVNNALYFIRHRAADFVLGRYGGLKAVGLFTVSYEISHLVTNELVAPINRAAFPAYAKMAENIGTLREGYLQVMSMISFVAIPAAVGIAATADLLVPILLGPNWVAAVSLIQILAFAGAIAIFETNIGAAYLALGRPQILTLAYSVFALTFLSLLALLVPKHGAIGAAQASLFAGLANLPLQIYLMRRTLDIGFRDLIDVFFRPIAASFLMYWVVRQFIERFSQEDDAFIELPLVLLSAIVVGAIVYVASMVLLWVLMSKPDGTETVIFSKVREVLAKRRINS